MLIDYVLGDDLFKQVVFGCSSVVGCYCLLVGCGVGCFWLLVTYTICILCLSCLYWFIGLLLFVCWLCLSTLSVHLYACVLIVVVGCC